jgi:ADP-ribose pyrophosphatase YjhB (NUDIX family)
LFACLDASPSPFHVSLLRGEAVLRLRRCNTGYEDAKLNMVVGHVEPGETITEAAHRESRREVGLDLIAGPSSRRRGHAPLGGRRED